MSTPTLASGEKGSAESKPQRRMKGIILLIMTICILVPSMIGFVNKFIEFIHTFQQSNDGAFAITPMLNYLLASIGFFCMLIWATLNGMFTDMERPKETMLELEEQLNQRGRQNTSLPENQHV